MTTTKITCPRCAHQYQRTYPKPIICPACGMYLHGCYNRADVDRDPLVIVQDGWFNDGRRNMIAIPNAFRTQECQINLPACGDCKWRNLP